VDQPGVYEHVRAAVEAALSGLNSTIMAYGQTGSGKSHTLFGGLNADDVPPAAGGASALEGVAARALRHVFAHAAAQEKLGSRVAISVSLLEVYNESMHDLLLPVIPAADAPATTPRPARGGSTFHPAGPAPEPPSLTLRLDSYKEIFVQGLAEVPLHSAAAALILVRRALRRRAVRSTDANARSSRSHAVLQLLIETSRAAAVDTGGRGGDTRRVGGDMRAGGADQRGAEGDTRGEGGTAALRGWETLGLTAWGLAAWLLAVGGVMAPGVAAQGVAAQGLAAPRPGLSPARVCCVRGSAS
jgi:hypothetical protein